MKKTALLLITFLASGNLIAQTNSVIVKLSLPNGSPAENVAVAAKKTKNTATTNADGVANLEIAIKDIIEVTDPKYYEVSVNVKNWNPADTVRIPMTPVEGTELDTYSGEGVATGKYNSYGDIYKAIKAVCPFVKVIGNCVVSNRSSSTSECALIIVDGRADANLSEINLPEVNSIEFLQTNQAAIYGTRARYGALVITTVGNTSKVLHK